MTPIRLVMADLDGTLLNPEHQVTPRTGRTVRKVMARGVQFTVATGKTFWAAAQWIREFDIRIPVICGNGTQVFAPDGTLLHSAPIERSLALELLQIGREGGFTPVIYLENGLLSNVWDANTAEIVSYHEPMPEIAPDLIAAVERGEYVPYKLMLMSQNPAEVDALHPRLDRIFAGRAQVIRSGLASVIELLPWGVTKGTAMQYILDYLGISAQDTIAFGDNCNDVDMLRRAGIGVAMGHSPQDVKDRADYVTGTNNEDGVAHVLEQLVLNSQSLKMVKEQR